MNPELWQRIKPLYESAVAMPEEERARFIAESCHNDSEARSALDEMLRHGLEDTDTLDAPVFQFRNMYPKNQNCLSPGDVLIDRFRILGDLGSGGMGTVYEAEDLLLQGKHIALKTILPHVANDPVLQHRFKREVLLAHEVLHPNLCPIYEIFNCAEPTPGFLFLTMKLLPGESLASRIRKPNPLSTEQRLAIVEQLALGVAAIHAAGIIHRDIKPTNIMLDGSGSDVRVWITDFGLAHAYGTDSTVWGIGTLAGTPGYIAPELFLGEPPSQATDLFALGIVLHEVCTGRKPDSVANGSHKSNERLELPDIPSLYLRLVSECIQEDPQRRLKAFDGFLQAIDPGRKRSHVRYRIDNLWTRRHFLSASIAGSCFVAAGAWWRWEDFKNLMHPLPQKRFVALLQWPKAQDATVIPVVTGVLTAIENLLTRAETSDRDLFAISPEDVGPDLPDITQLHEVCDSLGANLVLAASGTHKSDHVELSLKLLTALSGQPLREKRINCSLDRITSLPQMALDATATLFNLRHTPKSGERADPETQSAAAFTAFQSAEALMKQQNDAGLNGATEKYKEAVEADSHYALAHAKLALAYCRLAALRHDGGALELARGNAQLSITINPNLAEGHLAMAFVFEDTGHEDEALREIAKALASDPSDPRTLVWQAQIYRRLNRWADAEKTFRRVLNERPNYWLAYNELGVTLSHQGKYSEALDAFLAASAAAPGSSLALTNIGDCYLQLGRFSDATEYFQKSFAVKPNALAAVNIATTLRAQGKVNEGLPFALKAVDLDPGDDWNWMELADCYSSLPNRQKAARDAYQRAATEVERHLLTDKSDGAAWMQLTLYHAKLGAHEDAWSAIQKAETLGANDMESQLCKVRILEVLGRRDDALAAIKSCFERGATDAQVSSISDLRSLQSDPRYQSLVHLQPGPVA
jgi:serine/threonine protein kinase/tetratricopeptide (TPR) repeat protein